MRIIGGKTTGIIRIDIEGKWTVLEFTQLLEKVRSLYVDVTALDYVISSSESREKGFRSVEASLKYYRAAGIHLNQDIYIQSLHFMSPGWAEMLGSWNPLKVIADFITNWRKENTARQKIISTADLEKLRVRADFSKHYLDRLEILRTTGTSADVDYVIHSVLEPAAKAIKDIGEDNRVIDVQFSEVPQPPLLGPSIGDVAQPISNKATKKSGKKVSVKRSKQRGS